MSNQNPYEKLGVEENSTFDEIQTARTRLLHQYSGDAKRKEAIEAAYDAILMERLRMRQEGRIKVPEGVRFAERLSQSPAKEKPSLTKQTPAWLQQLIDQPSLADIFLPGLLFLCLAGLVGFYPALSESILQLSLVVGVGFSIYFIQRKEQKFGRAVLLTVIGLISGLLIGGLIGSTLESQISSITLTPERFSTILTFLLLWLISSFLR